MKRWSIIILIIIVLMMFGCFPITTEEVTTDVTSDVTTVTPTTEAPTTTEITTIINDEITIRLNAGFDTVEINGEWVDAGADLLINDVAHAMITIDTVDVTEFGVYHIHYAYTHSEIVYEIDRYVIVTDQTPPLLTLNLGIDTITVGEEWIDAGVIVSDNSGEVIDAVVSGDVDTNTAGTYVITYSATDSNGNSFLIYRYVTVIE